MTIYSTYESAKYNVVNTKHEQKCKKNLNKKKIQESVSLAVHYNTQGHMASIAFVNSLAVLLPLKAVTVSSPS